MLALLVSRGELEPEAAFITESIIGSEFELRVAGQRMVGDRTTITPSLSGSAYINGFLTVVADSRDQLRDGFQPG